MDMLQDFTIYALRSNSDHPSSTLAGSGGEIIEEFGRRGVKTRVFASEQELLQGPVSPPACVLFTTKLQSKDDAERIGTWVKTVYPLPVVVLLPEFADAALVVQAIRQGATSVVQQNTNRDEWIHEMENAFELSDKRRREAECLEKLQARMSRLTRDEQRVLQLITEGRPNKSIAAELELGLRTVEKRRHNIFEKLNAESVPDLVRIMMVANKELDCTHLEAAGGFQLSMS